MGGKTSWVSIGILCLLACVIFACAIAYLFGLPSPFETREVAIGGAGPIINGDVSVYALNSDGSRGDLLGSGVSTEYGSYFVVVNATPTDHLLVEITGGSYFDDALGIAVPLGNSESLTAVFPADNESELAMVTPLTHMAGTRARNLAADGTPIEVAVQSANNGVARQYAIRDIIEIVPASITDNESVAWSTMEERDYGLVLAGIAEEAEALDVPVTELADALADDAGDGRLDGKDENGQINMDTQLGSSIALPPDAGTAGVQRGVASASVPENLRANQANSAVPFMPMQLGINGAGKFYVTSTMLPAAVAGDRYSYRLAASGGAPPYACSLNMQNADHTVSALPEWLQLSSGCVLSGDVPLLRGGTSMTISFPFTVRMCDSANACADVELRLTTIEKRPRITPEDATCFENAFCHERIATAQGGTEPHYYRADYFRMGAPPMGTIVDVDGFLTGTPTVTGRFTVGVCVIDLIGASDCGTADVRVVPQNASLILRKTGSGTGKVYADPHEDGDVYAYGTEITLTAKADSGSSFAGWGGACSGSTTTKCTLIMDEDKEIEARFEGGGPQPSGELSVRIISGRCGSVNGEVSGPVGSHIGVYQNGGAPASKINCGSWTPGPETQYQCQRADNDPAASGWAAQAGGLVEATVYGPTDNIFAGGDIMKTAQASFPCR